MIRKSPNEIKRLIEQVNAFLSRSKFIKGITSEIKRRLKLLVGAYNAALKKRNKTRPARRRKVQVVCCAKSFELLSDLVAEPATA